MRFDIVKTVPKLTSFYDLNSLDPRRGAEHSTGWLSFTIYPNISSLISFVISRLFFHFIRSSPSTSAAQVSGLNKAAGETNFLRTAYPETTRKLCRIRAELRIGRYQLPRLNAISPDHSKIRRFHVSVSRSRIHIYARSHRIRRQEILDPCIREEGGGLDAGPRRTCSGHRP